MKTRLKRRAVFTQALAGWMALAVPCVASADLVNTASVSYKDSLGNAHAGTSNTVTVWSASLPAPTLNLPAFLPVNAQISATYTGADPASYFSWTFTPVSGATPGAELGTRNAEGGYSLKELLLPHSALRIPNLAPSASFTTASPTANLGSVQLGLGPYRVTVKVYDSNNNASAPAQAYVSLVPADLSTVRVYPNPWRSDRHAGKSVTFDGLTVNTTVKLFTVSGHWVKTLPMSSTSVTWDLTNDSGDKVASGIYLYVITTDQHQKKTGQIAVIK